MAREERLQSEPTGEVGMSLSLRFAAGSHKGMIREGNEDSGYAGPRLLAIADGMGGQAAGEVASSEVISTLVSLDDDVPGSDLLTSLGEAVQRANDQLRVMVEEDPQLEGMGTTLTALLWTGQRLGLVHVGDSRAYLLRDGELSQITQDHTWVQRLVDEGRITEEEATTHPQRSLLMRALGSGETVEPDLSIREVRAGDRYLICSDGLSGVVSHQTMEDTLASYQGPQETVEELIQLALRGGGPDNITLIVADVLDLAGPDSHGTLAEQLSDTPVIVGAVAENQHQSNNDGAMQTPAGRASGLGRAEQPPAGGEFGPPDSGAGQGYGGGAYGAYDGDGAGKRRNRWIKPAAFGALGLAVVAAALYGGYRWTQTQYYVGSNGEHVALYRGISQDVAWIDLSKVEKDHPEIELKYLPPYQQDKVEETIAEDGLAQANDKIDELSRQASACKKEEERREESKPAIPEDENPKGTPKESGKPSGSRERPLPSGEPRSAGMELPQVKPAVPAKPTPGPTLSDEEKTLVAQCGKK